MIQIITKLDEVINYIYIYIYIEYELIVPFQLQLKILHHVISQINLDKFFISNEHKCVEKKYLLKIYFHLKDNKKNIKGFYIKIHFICLLKH